MQLKLWFSFLLLHVIHALSSKQWLINVPKRIPAVEGSCVVIPCSYYFPWRKGMYDENVRKGFWKKGNTLVSSTRPSRRLTNEYRRRTYFVGNLHALNCSMLMEDVRSTDVGPFHLRIEVNPQKSYSYIKNPVYIDVIRNPPPPSMAVQGTGKVTVSCFVTHACPRSLPKFTWSRRGSVVRRFKKLSAWQWKSVSTLTFTPGPKAFNQTLKCTVWYSGGKQATGSMILPM